VTPLYYLRPTLHRGIRKSFLSGSSQTSVNLLLPSWGIVNPKEISDSLMDPWLNTVTEAQFHQSITNV
jgi:hypothetical protein